MFEYGCGSSTLWFARTAREVVSVEHVRAWHDSVKQQAPDNVSMLLRPATDEAGDNISAPYAAAIGEVAPPFDVIVVDGSERNACARLAMRALAPHGIIIFDNSNRPQYAPGLGALAAGGLSTDRFLRTDSRIQHDPHHLGVPGGHGPLARSCHSDPRHRLLSGRIVGFAPRQRSREDAPSEADMAAEWAAIDRRITALDKEFAAFARNDDRARHLASIPGIRSLAAFFGSGWLRIRSALASLARLSSLSGALYGVTARK